MMLPALKCNRCGKLVYAPVPDTVAGRACTMTNACDGVFERTPELDVPAKIDRLRDRPS